LKPTLRPHLSGASTGRYLAVSEFPPALAWKAHNAMTRNRTICGLSNALLVIESGTEGGTFEAGNTALKLGEPLFCVEYANPPPSAAGNPILLSMGAHPLKRGRSGQPNLNRLLAAARCVPEVMPTDSEPILVREDTTP
jgi:predicted Rossmann fold nucleotide-binding protein DprA/Smf involved in DNA uptake